MEIQNGSLKPAVLSYIFCPLPQDAPILSLQQAQVHECTGHFAFFLQKAVACVAKIAREETPKRSSERRSETEADASKGTVPPRDDINQCHIV